MYVPKYVYTMFGYEYIYTINIYKLHDGCVHYYNIVYISYIDKTFIFS